MPLQNPSVLEQNAAMQEAKSSQKKEMNMPMVILLILVAIALIAGGVFMYLYFT